MNYLSLIIKNKQYNQIVSDFNRGINSHAYLLASEDSLFTENMAYLLAASITGAKHERIEKNVHPDVFVYGKNGKIDVSQVTELVADINVAPYEADKKIYVLLNIENMNDTSQNKILKSLEEPPKNVIFILTCANIKNILSTVLSRVKQMKIDPIANQDIVNLLTENGAKSDMVEVAVSAAGGNSTLAQKLTTQNFLQMYNNIIEMLNNISGSKDCLKYITMFENKNIDKTELIDTLMLLVRDIALIIAESNDLVINKHHINVLTTIAKQFNLQATSNIISECLRLKEDLYYNTNNTVVLDRLILKLAQEKAKCRK